MSCRRENSWPRNHHPEDENQQSHFTGTQQGENPSTESRHRPEDVKDELTRDTAGRIRPEDEEHATNKDCHPRPLRGEFKRWSVRRPHVVKGLANMGWQYKGFFVHHGPSSPSCHGRVGDCHHVESRAVTESSDAPSNCGGNISEIVRQQYTRPVLECVQSSRGGMRRHPSPVLTHVQCE